MRKSKSDIRQRIRDLAESVDHEAIQAVMLYNPDPNPTYLWFLKLGWDAHLDTMTKRELAALAMCSHRLLPE